MTSFSTLLLSLLSACVASRLPELGEEEGLMLPSSGDLRMFLSEHDSHPKVRESKELLSLAMTISFVWSFGGPLNVRDKALLSQIVTESKSMMMAKYTYPRSTNVYDQHFDWKAKEFRGFDRSDVARLSANSSYDPITKVLCVPTVTFLQVRHVVEMAMFGSTDAMLLNVPQASVWVELQAPEGAGKTACTHYLIREFQQYISSAACTMSPLMSQRKLTSVAFSLFSWKTRTSATPLSSRKPTLVVDDLHLDESQHISESLEFWFSHSGSYDPSDCLFKSTKDLSFLTVSQSRKAQRCLALFVEPPDSEGLRDIMTVYIFSRKFTTDSLVHRWSTTLIKVLMSARKVSCM